MKEKVLQTEIARSLEQEGHHVQMEYQTRYGRIDILTEDMIIEVKTHLEGSHCREAIGQLICQSYAFPNHRLILACSSVYIREELQYVLGDLDITVWIVGGTLVRSPHAGWIRYK